MSFRIYAASFLLAAGAAQAQSAPPVAEAPLRAHLSFLADDLLEGRGTGQRGGELTVRYLETQAAVLGLKPLADGGYRQKVELVGQKTLPGSQLRFVAGGRVLPATFGQDVVFGNASGSAATRVSAPLVFVGYGIDAPDERWNDFLGADVKGKVLVAMVNDPQPTSAEPDRFGGKSLTWYGRWTYKFEEAVRQGAAGILLIHTTPSASYPWSVPVNSFSHEQFHLAGKGNALQGWISEDMARTLLAASGQPTLLISGDLRWPRLDTVLHVDGKPGFSDLLAAQQSGTLTEERLRATILRGEGRDRTSGSADILPAGTMSSDAARLLSSGAVEPLMDMIRRLGYTYVIVDATPLLGIADARLLARAADKVLVVGRLERISVPAAMDLRDELGRLGTPILGMVVIGGTSEASPYYSGVKFVPPSESGQASRSREESFR